MEKGGTDGRLEGHSGLLKTITIQGTEAEYLQIEINRFNVILE
jgi:hypothetical protein